MHKEIFINGHEQSDVIEDYKTFFKKIEELKPYIIEFEENSAIKSKVYLPDCKVGGNH